MRTKKLATWFSNYHACCPLLDRDSEFLISSVADISIFRCVLVLCLPSRIPPSARPPSLHLFISSPLLLPASLPPFHQSCSSWRLGSSSVRICSSFIIVRSSASSPPPLQLFELVSASLAAGDEIPRINDRKIRQRLLLLCYTLCHYVSQCQPLRPRPADNRPAGRSIHPIVRSFLRGTPGIF